MLLFNPVTGVVKIQVDPRYCTECKAHPKLFTLHCIKCHETFFSTEEHKCNGLLKAS